MYQNTVGRFVASLLVGLCIAGPLCAQSENTDLLELLTKSQFAEASAMIESIADNETPQLTYWHAVCLAVDGRETEAIAKCQSVVKRWPESEHANDARTFAEFLDRKGNDADRIASLYFDTIGGFRDEQGVWEFSCRSENNDQNEDHTIRFAVDFQKEACELLITNQGDTHLQFQANQQGSRWYRQGDDQVLAFSESFFPVLSFSIEQSPDDSFLFNMSGSISSKSEAAESTLQDLLNSEWFSTREGCRQLFVDRARAHATFPVGIEEKDGLTTCRFAKPDFQNGGFDYTFNEFGDRYIQTRTSSTGFLFRLKPTGTVPLVEQFQWPEVEVVEQELDIAFVAQFFQAVIRNFENGDKQSEF